MEILILILLLSLKHFIVDFPLQKPYQYLNKGTYGHFGGILHSGLHGIGTFLCFLLAVNPILALLFGIIDSVVHYHVDWAKVKINSRYGLKPDNSEMYWWLLGLDQFLHMLTYIGLVSLILIGV